MNRVRMDASLAPGLVGLGLIVLVSTNAAAGDGAITPRFLDRLAGWQPSVSERVMGDAVASRDIDEIALNRGLFVAHDGIVNHRIKTGEITNQKGSGRCWMFAGFNVLRPAVIEKYKLKSFEFSESYLMFWDKMEKANFFLQSMIDRAGAPLDDRYVESLLDGPLGDGGWWSYFVDLVEKYGVVPREAMPETHSSSSTGRMNALIERKLKEMGLELRNRAREGASADELSSRREEMLVEVHRMLVLNLGAPPREFSWRYETTDSTSVVMHPVPLTPLAFLEEVVDVDLHAYISLFDYPGKEYFRTYSFETGRNLYDRPDFSVLNVPMDSLRACILRSVLDSTAVWFACDVGMDNYGKAGVMAPGIYNYEEIYGTHFGLPRRDMIELGLITPNHAMTIVGVDTLEARPVKWLVENSWGGEAGDDGLWYMYDGWIDRYVFGAVVRRDYVSDDLWELWRQEPIPLKPWDPMSTLSRLELSRDER